MIIKTVSDNMSSLFSAIFKFLIFISGLLDYPFADGGLKWGTDVYIWSGNNESKISKCCQKYPN